MSVSDYELKAILGRFIENRDDPMAMVRIRDGVNDSPGIDVLERLARYMLAELDRTYFGSTVTAQNMDTFNRALGQRSVLLMLIDFRKAVAESVAEQIERLEKEYER